MDTWYVITRDGKAVSYATIVADPLPDGCQVRELTPEEVVALQAPTGAIWDEETMAVTEVNT